MIIQRPFSRAPSLLAAALVSAALVVPSAARAQVSDADRATARALAVEGQHAYDKQDYATAAERFARADALVHAPTLLLALARAEVGLGKLVSAQEAYNRILREGVAPGSPPVFTKALEDARKEVDRLAPRVPSITIVVKGSKAAAVTIDGARVPAAALGVKRPVDPGKHKVRATAEGMAPAEVELTIGEGKHETTTLVLEPPKAATVAPPSVAPPIAPPPAPAADKAPGSGRRIAGFALLGVGGAGLVMGAVTGGLAVKQHGDLATACGGGKCPESAYGKLDSYHLLGTLSTVGLVVGAASAGAGAILVLTAPKASPKNAAFVTPVIGPAYLGVEGSF